MRTHVRGLPAPPLLLTLLETGRWRHPGKAAVKRVMPSLPPKLEFLPSLDEMALESASLDEGSPAVAAIFKEHRGSRIVGRSRLPWIDIEQAFFVVVNSDNADDATIALDYRTSKEDPRVITCVWEEVRCHWEEVSPTFSAWVGELGL